MYYNRCWLLRLRHVVLLATTTAGYVTKICASRDWTRSCANLECNSTHTRGTATTWWFASRAMDDPFTEGRNWTSTRFLIILYIFWVHPRWWAHLSSRLNLQRQGVYVSNSRATRKGLVIEQPPFRRSADLLTLGTFLLATALHYQTYFWTCFNSGWN